MAIVIKVKGDTKELEKDIQQAAQKAKATLDQATRAVGAGAGGATNKLSDEFKKLRAEGEAASKRLDEVKKGSEGVGGSMLSASKAATIATTAITAVASAAIAAAAAFVKMGLEGSKLADTLIETAFAAGKTVEEMQKLEKGGRDLTARLREVGGVLDYEIIKKASRATDEFAVFWKQLDAVRILVAADMSDAFTGLGRTINNALVLAKPVIRGFAGDIAFVIEQMTPLLSKLLLVATLTAEFERRKARLFIDDAPPSRTSTLALGHGPQFVPTTELRDFLRSPQALARAQSLRTSGGGRVAGAGGGGGVDLAREDERIQQERLRNQEEINRLKAHTLETELEILAATAKEAQTATANMVAARERIAALQGRVRAGDQGPIATITAEQAGISGALDTTRRDIIEAQSQIFDEIRQQAIRFKEGIVFTFESAFREGFERGPKAFLQATASAIKSFFSQIAAELSTGIIELILFGKGGMSGRGVGTTGTLGGLRAALGGFGGGGGGAGGGGGVAGFFGGGGGGGGGIGGFISSFFGGGGGGGGGSIGVAGSTSGGFGGAFGSVANFAAQKQGLFGFGGGAGGGLVAGLGTFAGTGLLGGLLGTGLGGKSTAGKILGGIGGGILGAGGGILGFTALGGVISGTGLGTAGLATIGLLTNPFTLAIGGALLLGAYLLGKSKQRRSDEQAADAIWVEEREQVRQLIQAVNADRIDGASALEQAQALRSQTVSQLQQIKTKSVRDSRLTNQLRDLDSGVVAELRAAVARQASRRNTGSFLVPEFASGGYVPGIDRGYDSVTAKLRPGELVLTQQHQSRIKARAGSDVFAEAGVGVGSSSQRYQNGGYVRADTGGVPTINIILEGDAAEIAGSLIVKGVTTSGGQRAIVNVIKTSRRNGDL